MDFTALAAFGTAVWFRSAHLTLTINLDTIPRVVVAPDVVNTVKRAQVFG